MENKQIATFALCLKRSGLPLELRGKINDLAMMFSFPFNGHNVKREARRAKLTTDSTTVLFEDELERGRHVFNQATTLMEYTSCEKVGGGNPYHYGMCLADCGFFVDVIFPRKRSAKPVCVVPMSSDGHTLARDEVASFLDSHGICAAFRPGRLD